VTERGELVTEEGSAEANTKPAKAGLSRATRTEGPRARGIQTERTVVEPPTVI
jgi:hypothetical protein